MTEETKSIARQSTEASNIEEAAHEDAGFDALLLFKKGDYFIDEKVVPLGTAYVARPEAWVKLWRKYDGEQVTKRHVYHVARGERVPQREDLDDWPDTDSWPVDDDGKAYDPWALFYLVPFENPETGEMVIFSTRSVGGRRAVADLCTAWAKRCRKVTHCGPPKIKIDVTVMPSKKWGPVKRPSFQIIGWDEPSGGGPSKDIEVLSPPDDAEFGGRNYDEAPEFSDEEIERFQREANERADKDIPF